MIKINSMLISKLIFVITCPSFKLIWMSFNESNFEKSELKISKIDCLHHSLQIKNNFEIFFNVEKNKKAKKFDRIFQTFKKFDIKISISNRVILKTLYFSQFNLILIDKIFKKLRKYIQFFW